MPKFSFEKYWQQLIKGIDENPPESVWENIQDELDIDEVWTRIDQNIPAPTNYLHTGFKVFLKLAVILLLIFLPKNERIRNTDENALSFQKSSTTLSPSDSATSENNLALNNWTDLSENKKDLFQPKNETKSEGDTKPGKAGKSKIIADSVNDQLPVDKKQVLKESFAINSLTNLPKNEKALVQNEQKDENYRRDSLNILSSVSEETQFNGESISNNLEGDNSQLGLSSVKSNKTKLSKINQSEDLLDNEEYANATANEVVDENKLTQYRNAEKETEKERAKNQQIVGGDALTFLALNKLDNIAPIFEFREGKIKDSIAGVSQKNINEMHSQPLLRFAGIGLNGALKNSRLMNNDTRVANSGNSLSSTSTTFTKDFGVSVQWQTRKKQMLQVSYLFISESGQTYNQYNEARYGQRRLNINYQTLSMEFIQPVHFTNAYLIAGPYLSKIQSVEESVNGNLRDFTNDYQDWEYGINLGIQYKMAFLNKFSVQPSVKFQYGLNNIFKGNNLIPANFNSTNPVNISFGLGIFYHFTK